MSAPPPPVPPRPYSSAQDRHGSLPPPVPPLPPDFRVQDNRYHHYDSPPHFADPLVAPRPQRLDPALPANMARNLDEQVASSYQDIRRPSPAPPLPPQLPLPNFSGPFAVNSPPPPTSLHQPWTAPPTNPPANIISSPPPSMPFPPYNQPIQPDDPSRTNSFSFVNPQSQPRYRVPSTAPSTYTPRPKPPSPPKQLGAPSLVSPLPSIQTLSAAVPSIQQPNHDPSLKITWCRDVLFLVDRFQQIAATDAPVGPAYIADPQLARLAQIAVPLVLQIASTQPIPNPMPLYLAEAIYLRATFAASGSHPDLVPRNPRSAFRDFEQAARGGYAAAWFKLGRDYENFNDITHARECFERGVKMSVESCTYRMGMAHLMGQLGLPANPEQAVPLLHRAATLASLDVPQPAYVYGLLLLGEFSHVTIPPNLFRPFLPPGSTPMQEARKHLERAAYLNFAPAQYKLGHAYEFAQTPFPFDALLSVQYYSLASQQGENEADMALSKWFLCGAEGAFDKDESLAWTFAEKAARKGLPSAEFAMGYYAEVGVGCPKDVDVARKWYVKASEHGNADAAERLQALSQPQPQALSRQEHNSITENKLIRKRTQARQRTAAMPPADAHNPATPSPGDGRRIVEVIRKNSLAQGVTSYPTHRLQSMPENGSPRASPPPVVTTQQRLTPSSSDLSGLPAARPRLAQSAQRAPPTMHRYTLSDSQTPTPPAGVEQQRKQNVESTVSQQEGSLGQPGMNARVTPGNGLSQTKPAPQKGPTTFAEMGFQSSKADDKDCIIM